MIVKLALDHTIINNNNYIVSSFCCMYMLYTCIQCMSCIAHINELRYAKKHAFNVQSTQNVVFNIHFVIEYMKNEYNFIYL